MRCAAIVAAAVVMAMTLASLTSAQDIQLPAAVYDNAAGEWGVEVLSSCRSPTYGTVKVQNTTARVEWEDEGAPDVMISGQSAESPLSLAALADFMSKDGKEYVYTTCEHQENYLATPQRPGAAAQLTSTYMTMYTGVLAAAGDGTDCTSGTHRNVVVQALGAPPKATSQGQWRLQEALYAIEVVIETKDLDGTCAHMRSAEVVDTALESKRRSRKRRTGRGFTSASATSQADEALTESGTVTIRFIRRTAAASPWAVRYYTPILFASIVIIYRVVHSFVSAKTAKSGA